MNVTTMDHLHALYGQCDRGHIVFTKKETVSAYFDVKRLDLAAKHVEREPLDLFFKVNVMDHDATLARSKFGVGGVKEVAAVVSFHLDVDAAKDCRYLTQELMLEGVYKMPLKPSLIVLTNRDDGGTHAYWFLKEPYYFDPTNDEDRRRVGRIATRWQRELATFCKPGKLDGTANLDRVLRPIGSLRESGNVVRSMIWNSERRYALDDFILPDKEPERQNYQPIQGESIIEKYLDDVGLNHPTEILRRLGYSHVRDNFWVRPNSNSGAPTGEVWTGKNGKLGFTFKSGASHPFDCMNADGSVGRWYSTAEMFVVVYYDGDWKKAAASCYEHFDEKAARAQPVDTSGVDRQPVSGKQPEQTEQPKPEQPKTEQPKAESTNSPVTHCAANVLDDYMTRLKSGKLPQLLRQYSALKGIEVGPEMITVLAAYPGKGKTALTSQIMFDGMELDPELRAVVANAETGFDVLIRRQLSRITSIPSRNIRFGNLTEYDVGQLNQAADELRPRLARVEVLAKPFKLSQLMRLVNSKPGLLIVDYLQKFIPHEAKDPRIGVNMVMDGLRELASVGWAVIAISATNRPGKEALAKLSMNSLRESSEIEFQADSIYLLNDDGPVDDAKPWIRNVTLDHAKNRHDKPESKSLVFNQPRMEFTARPTEHESQFANDFPQEQPARRNAFGGCK